VSLQLAPAVLLIAAGGSAEMQTLTWVMGRRAAGEHHSPAFGDLHGVSLFCGELLQN